MKKPILEKLWPFPTAKQHHGFGIMLQFISLRYSHRCDTIGIQTIIRIPMYEMPLASVMKIIRTKRDLYANYAVTEYVKVTGSVDLRFHSYTEFLKHMTELYREPKKWYDFLFKKKLIIYAEATHEHRKLFRIHDIVYVVPK
jgi:hypothetical protein